MPLYTRICQVKRWAFFPALRNVLCSPSVPITARNTLFRSCSRSLPRHLSGAEGRNGAVYQAGRCLAWAIASPPGSVLVALQGLSLGSGRHWAVEACRYDSEGPSAPPPPQDHVGAPSCLLAGARPSLPSPLPPAPTAATSIRRVRVEHSATRYSLRSVVI